MPKAPPTAGPAAAEVAGFDVVDAPARGFGRSAAGLAGGFVAGATGCRCP